MSVGWRSLGHGVSVGWESWGHQGVSVGSSCCGMSVGSWGSPRGICGVIGWWGVFGVGVMGSWGCPRGVCCVGVIMLWGVCGVMGVCGVGIVGSLGICGGTGSGGVCGVGVMGSPRGICGVVMLWGHGGNQGYLWGHRVVGCLGWGSWGHGVTKGCQWGHWIRGCLWGGRYGAMGVTKGCLLCGGRHVVGCLG